LAHVIKPASGGERLDICLVRRGLADSRREARRLINAGYVLVNGRRCAKGRSVSAGDTVEIRSRFAPALLTPDFSLSLDVLYRDEEILVVNKPGLLPCHPLHGEDRPTLMNAVVAHFPTAAHAGNKPLEGGLIHRLDNGTSGAVMIALNPEGFAYLRAALKENKITRHYTALVQGVMENPLELNASIAHHPRNRRKMIVVHDEREASRLRARPAVTIAAPVRRVDGFTLVQVMPRSGTRHQIRAHLADGGFPIAGDELYGGAAMQTLAPQRFFLHLAELRIPRMETGQNPPASQTDSARAMLHIVAPLPVDLQECIDEIEQ
jgi:23S rRNA pseudouridine1911/1915/1917 synthase